MAEIDASGIRKVFDLAQHMRNPINLSIGQPHFDVPEAVKEAANKAMHNGYNKYTPTQGLESLRQVLRKGLKTEFGWKDAMDRPMLITSGVSGALDLAFTVLINPGDEVIMCDPYFVMYKHLTKLYGGVPVLIDTYPDFILTPDALEAAITEKTKIICLNTPGNPSGTVYSRDILKQIADIARKHGLLVVSDEIYKSFCYDDEFTSIAEFYPENTLLMRGFSKSHSMTGWRMGWVTGPAEIVQTMTTLQQYTYVCAPSIAQAATLVALETDMSKEFADYKRKRGIIFDGLKDKFGLVKPSGAFYAFVPSPKGITSTDFVKKAIENNVLIIPGNVFSSRDTHFRLSFATSDETLYAGIKVLNSIA